MCGEELYLIDGSSVATVVMEILGRNGSVDHSLGSMVSSVVHVWFYLSATRYISTLFGLLPRCMLSSAFQGQVFGTAPGRSLCSCILQLWPTGAGIESVKKNLP